MTFGQALDQVIKNDFGMRLPSWSAEVLVKAKFPSKDSELTAPYLYVESRFGVAVWKETMIELFSEDWVLSKG